MLPKSTELSEAVDQSVNDTIWCFSGELQLLASSKLAARFGSETNRREDGQESENNCILMIIYR